MPAWLLPVLAIEAASWAALFAVLADRRQRHGDREGVRTCVQLSSWSLLAGLGFLIWSMGT
ncbi:hypothetical protein MKK70_04890 [Methylobacterium sp. E-041]|uniref:hypothetical protein n=1 Tax=Methylobacterium sp. E-041 TaxID=2836573 RepID=UPI001FBA2D09|nr:hypothetical protein [Methylobacterium sp. E-041]MCJ2104723.1 hypothetical protein [Methylobacterium sp. E-041]